MKDKLKEKARILKDKRDELSALLERREFIASQLYRITPTYKTDCIQESNQSSSKVEKYVIELADVEEKISSKIRKILLLERILKSIIECSDNVNYKRLLYMRYVYLWKWADIAERFGDGFTVEYVRGQMRDNALNSLTFSKTHT